MDKNKKYAKKTIMLDCISLGTIYNSFIMLIRPILDLGNEIQDKCMPAMIKINLKDPNRGRQNSFWNNKNVYLLVMNLYIAK